MDLNKVKERIVNTVATNKNEIYNSHLYWSQKGYNIIDILIEELSDEGDIVFDPFMGSGVTVIEANKKKRAAIGCDINDVPVFIVKTLLKKYPSLIEIEMAINSFNDKLCELSTLYKTNCLICNSDDAIVEKTTFDKTDWKHFKEIKQIDYRCTCSKKTLSKAPDKRDIQHFFCAIDKLNVIQDEFLIENSRLAAHKGQKMSDIFTKRNLKVLDDILSYIHQEDKDIQPLLHYVLLGILHLCKITDQKSNSQWPLWTPKNNCVEKNVINLFTKRSKALLASLFVADDVLPTDRMLVNRLDKLNQNNYFIHKGPIQKFDQIPKESIDLVITDPPYLGQVLYSEYMQLYKPFLNFSFNLNDEIVISTSPERKKDEADYYLLLETAFRQVGNVLKNNKYMCMYFHDSSLKVWSKLIKIMAKNNLVYITQVHIKKTKKTVKNILSPKKSLNGDAILFFKKQSSNSFMKNNLANDLNLNTIEAAINDKAKTIIENLGGTASTPELYDSGIMEYLISQNLLDRMASHYTDLTDIFQKELYWNTEKGVWQIS